MILTRTGSGALVSLGCELTVWMQMLAYPDHPARRWEPKRLRLRLFSAPGQHRRPRPPEPAAPTPPASLDSADTPRPEAARRPARTHLTRRPPHHPRTPGTAGWNRRTRRHRATPGELSHPDVKISPPNQPAPPNKITRQDHERSRLGRQNACCPGRIGPGQQANWLLAQWCRITGRARCKQSC
jgi:hypothetical protein